MWRSYCVVRSTHASMKGLPLTVKIVWPRLMNQLVQEFLHFLIHLYHISTHWEINSPHVTFHYTTDTCKTVHLIWTCKKNITLSADFITSMILQLYWWIISVIAILVVSISQCRTQISGHVVWLFTNSGRRETKLEDVGILPSWKVQSILLYLI